MNAPSCPPPALLRPIIVAIPEQLRELHRWVHWASTPDDEGRTTKQPFCVRTGVLASSTDPSTWATFPEALAESPVPGSAAGIGVVLGDGLAGVDLDACRDPQTGDIAPWAWQVIHWLDSYTEVSPSETGVKIFLSGTLPPGRRVLKAKIEGRPRAPAIEMYDGGRYFTVTGMHVAGTPTTIEGRDGPLRELHRRLFDRPVPQDRPAARPNAALPPTLEDEAVLSAARHSQQGARFAQLYDRGDWSDYGSQSEADLACCNWLRFWTGGDPGQIDRLFRRSGLMRAKWDERRGRMTYGEKTIAKALPGTTYQPLQRDGANGNGRQSHGDVPLESTPDESGPVGADDLHFTDMGNSRRLAMRHGADLKFTAHHGWMVYDGCRFKLDETGAAAERAKEMVRALYADAARLPDQARQALAAWALKSEAATRIRAMLELARSEPEIGRETRLFDQHPLLLNCPNGTIDLETGRLRDHNRADLLTQLCPVPYDPDALCPTYDTFLDRVLDGNAELIAFMRRAVGCSLTADVSVKCLFFLFGGGDNGKSTLLNLLLALLGDYGMPAPPRLLLERGNEQHPTQIADLAGKRFVSTVEVGQGKKLAEELVKGLTGADHLKGRLMRQDFFSFLPTHKLWLAANHKPVIKGTDDAIWDRIPLIPFSVKFTTGAADPRRRKDPHLSAKLAAELPGILAWGVRGCREWLRDGLQPPKLVQEATAAYRAEMDVLAGFIEDECVLSTIAQATAKGLYESYTGWCERNREQALSHRSFSDSLRERGLEPVRIGHARDRGWRGIGLRTDSLFAEGR